MFSMFANRRIRIAAFTACVTWTFLCPGAEKITSSLTGNDITSLAGNGDTLLLTTTAGINFVIDSSDTMHWWGYETDDMPWAPASGGGTAFACLYSSGPQFDNRFWLYDHASAAVSVQRLPWDDTRTFGDTLLCHDALWLDGYYWLACYDGGLVKWEPRRNRSRVFVPGINGLSYALNSFPGISDTSFNRLDRAAAKTIALDKAHVDPEQPLLYVATPHRIWSFSITDSTWDTLGTFFTDGSLRLVNYRSVRVNNHGEPPAVFAVIATAAGRNPTADTAVSLFKYDSGAGAPRWTRFCGQVDPVAVTFGPDNLVYVATENRMELYRDTAGTVHLPLRTPLTNTAVFRNRMIAATDEIDALNCTINDVLLTTDAGKGSWRLWIATTEGLFFSRNENPGAQSEEPFNFIKRSPRLPAGLGKTYAYPGILTETWDSWQTAKKPEVRFAYNLDENARVTIKIYDWNMDWVTTVIENEPRLAGKNRDFGRSTELGGEHRDTWDGRDHYGNVVSPGVYYYKISTDKGGKAFGKIVVALRR